MKSSRKKHRQVTLLATGLLTISLVLATMSYTFLGIYKNDNTDAVPKELEKIAIDKNIGENIEKTKKDHYVCLKEKYEKENFSDAIKEKEKNITEYITDNAYDISVYYENLSIGYVYSYKPAKIYYGCSLIKIVDALYLLEKAIDGEIDLDEVKITYTSAYHSSMLARYRIGEKVPLRTLLEYAVKWSDNGSHKMLIDYIGFSNLKNYGTSLGAKVILTGGDKFGNQTAEDTNIYLKKAYEIIGREDEYGKFLKSIMDNDKKNSLSYDDVKIYHKYGSYGEAYHDIGLYLENNPYTISVLTNLGNRDYKSIIQNIHSKIRELNELAIEEKNNYCLEKINAQSS